MIPIEQPIKEPIRQCLAHRKAEKRALPAMEEIRRRLGWNLVGTQGRN